MVKSGQPDLGSFIEEADRSLALSVWWRDICLELLSDVDFKDWRYVHQHGEQVHGLVTLFERAQAQATKDIVSYGRLDIADRKQKLDEHQATMIVSVIKAALSEISLNREQKAQVAPAIARALREIEGPKHEEAA